LLPRGTMLRSGSARADGAGAVGSGRSGSGIDDSANLDDAIGRKSPATGMIEDGFGVRCHVHAVERIVRYVALDPVVRLLHAAEHLVGGTGDFVKLFRRHVAESRDLPFDDELPHDASPVW